MILSHIETQDRHFERKLFHEEFDFVRTTSCKICWNFLRVKFKVFNLPQNMAFSNNNIYKFKILNRPLFQFPTDQYCIWHSKLVDCIVPLTFVLTKCLATKFSSLTSHMVNLPHGWYPRTLSFLQLCWGRWWRWFTNFPTKSLHLKPRSQFMSFKVVKDPTFLCAFGWTTTHILQPTRCGLQSE